jgi:hypothetical protein
LTTPRPMWTVRSTLMAWRTSGASGNVLSGAPT